MKSSATQIRCETPTDEISSTSGTTQRDWGEEAGGRGGSGWGTHVHPWLIHVDVWEKTTTILQSN